MIFRTVCFEEKKKTILLLIFCSEGIFIYIIHKSYINRLMLHNQIAYNTKLKLLSTNVYTYCEAD